MEGFLVGKTQPEKCLSKFGITPVCTCVGGGGEVGGLLLA